MNWLECLMYVLLIVWVARIAWLIVFDMSDYD